MAPSPASWGCLCVQLPEAQPSPQGPPPTCWGSICYADGWAESGDPQLGSAPCCLWDSCLIHHQGLLAGWAGQLHEWPARAFRGHQVGTKCLSLQRPLSSQGGWVHGQTTPASLSLQNPGQVPRGAACRGREDSGGLAAGGVNPRVYAAG